MGNTMKAKHFDTSKLFKIRKEKNMTYDDVADIIGISRNTIWSLENGKFENPSFGFIVKLARVFEVSVEYFIKD